MRSRVSPWPSVGAGVPHAMHGCRIIAAAWDSAIANGTPCSEATRWYALIRAICGSTRELLLLGKFPAGFRFSMTRRHFEQQSGWSEETLPASVCAVAPDDDAAAAAAEEEEEAAGAEAEAAAAEEKKAATVCCLVVSPVRRQAKHSTLTCPSSSFACLSFFFLLAMMPWAVCSPSSSGARAMCCSACRGNIPWPRENDAKPPEAARGVNVALRNSKKKTCELRNYKKVTHKRVTRAKTQTRSSFAMPLYPTTLPGHPRLHLINLRDGAETLVLTRVTLAVSERCASRTPRPLCAVPPLPAHRGRRARAPPCERTHTHPHETPRSHAACHRTDAAQRGHASPPAISISRSPSPRAYAAAPPPGPSSLYQQARLQEETA